MKTPLLVGGGAQPLAQGTILKLSLMVNCNGILVKGDILDGIIYQVSTVREIVTLKAMGLEAKSS